MTLNKKEAGAVYSALAEYYATKGHNNSNEATLRAVLAKLAREV